MFKGSHCDSRMQVGTLIIFTSVSPMNSVSHGIYAIKAFMNSEVNTNEDLRAFFMTCQLLYYMYMYTLSKVNVRIFS